MKELETAQFLLRLPISAELRSTKSSIDSNTTGRPALRANARHQFQAATGEVVEREQQKLHRHLSAAGIAISMVANDIGRDFIPDGSVPRDK